MAGVRAGIRRTRCGGHRGRARPIIGYEIPAADDLAPPPPLGANADEAPARCRPRSTGGGGRMDLRHPAPALGLPPGGPARGRASSSRDDRFYHVQRDTTLSCQAAVLPSSGRRVGVGRAIRCPRGGGHPRRAAAAGGPPIARPAAGRESLPLLLLSRRSATAPSPPSSPIGPMIPATRPPRCTRARAAGTLPAHLLRVAVRATRIGFVRGNAAAPVHGPVPGPPRAHHGRVGRGRARFAQLSPRVRRGALSRQRGAGGRHGGAGCVTAACSPPGHSSRTLRAWLTSR